MKNANSSVKFVFGTSRRSWHFKKGLKEKKKEREKRRRWALALVEGPAVQLLAPAAPSWAGPSPQERRGLHRQERDTRARGLGTEKRSGSGLLFAGPIVRQSGFNCCLAGLFVHGVAGPSLHLHGFDAGTAAARRSRSTSVPVDSLLRPSLRSAAGQRGKRSGSARRATEARE